MKKFFSLMAVLAAMFTFVACTKGTDEVKKLATPELTETHTETSFTVAWNAVSGAEAYVVNFSGKNYTTAECSYTFENLNGGTYSVRVKATGKGYEDSDNASISVEITGLTGEVDWFEQTLANLTEPYELEEDYVAYPYNAVFFTWKGTGITEIKYAAFPTADLEGVSDKEIKKELLTIDPSVLSYVNSEEGYTSIIGDLSGSTSYTLCALATNEAGLEYFVKGSITTAEAELTAETKAWIGSYNATASKLIDISTNTISEQTTDFTFTVSSIEGTPDEVYVDGLSIMGTDTPAIGMVAADGKGNNLLAVWNYVMFSEMGEGWNLYWYALCDTMGDYYFVSGNYPAMIFTQDKDGKITCERYVGQLGDGSRFEVLAFDLIGVSEQGFGIPQDQAGNKFSVWKYGDYTNITKVEATAAVANCKAMDLSIAKVLPTSVVVAK
jgi:hypothetical protein